MRWRTLGAAAAATLLAATVAACGAPAPKAHRQTAPATAAPVVVPTATPTPTPPAVVTFSVTGTAPEGVSITYGTDNSNLNGGALPWAATLPLDNSGKVLYYDVSAQLQGPDGSIACSISIGGKVISSGTAAGNYNICSAQIGQGLDGTWSSE
ncbi:MAG TPA: hypothetical protein VNH20_07010 [Candidatus Dormibacteraeota bacterium]|nr:hypothetical protein [Candidatus Dormibacteraeota bacterium]